MNEVDIMLRWSMVLFVIGLFLIVVTTVIVSFTGHSKSNTTDDNTILDGYYICTKEPKSYSDDIDNGDTLVYSEEESYHFQVKDGEVFAAFYHVYYLFPAIDDLNYFVQRQLLDEGLNRKVERDSLVIQDSRNYLPGEKSFSKQREQLGKMGYSCILEQ